MKFRRIKKSYCPRRRSPTWSAVIRLLSYQLPRLIPVNGSSLLSRSLPTWRVSEFGLECTHATFCLKSVWCTVRYSVQCVCTWLHVALSLTHLSLWPSRCDRSTLPVTGHTLSLWPVIPSPCDRSCPLAVIGHLSLYPVTSPCDRLAVTGHLSLWLVTSPFDWSPLAVTGHLSLWPVTSPCDRSCPLPVTGHALSLWPVTSRCDWSPLPLTGHLSLWPVTSRCDRSPLAVTGHLSL